MVKKKVEELFLELVYERFYAGGNGKQPSFYFKDINSGKHYEMYPRDLDALLDSSSIVNKRVSGVFKKCYRGGSETIQYIREVL